MRRQTGIYERDIRREDGKVVLEYYFNTIPERIEQFYEECKHIPWILPLEVEGRIVSFPWFENTSTLKDRKFTPQTKESLKYQLIDFVVELNKAGWAHRDLHQKNILWWDNQIIVIDWEFCYRNPVSIEKSYDLTGKGLDSPLNSRNMNVFHKSSVSLKRLLPNLKIEDFVQWSQVYEQL